MTERALVAEPVVGWRLWQISQPSAVTLDAATLDRMARAHEEGRNPFVGLAAARLCALATDLRWDTPVMDARCEYARFAGWGSFLSPLAPMPEPHDTPGRDCRCGVWALKSRESMYERIGQLALRPPPSGLVIAFGQVQLWGRIVEHESGYRGQHARPLDVQLVGKTDREAYEIAAFYNCTARAGPLPDEAAAAVQKAAEREREAAAQHVVSYNQMLTQMMQGVSAPPPANLHALRRAYGLRALRAPRPRRRWWSL